MSRGSLQTPAATATNNNKSNYYYAVGKGTVPGIYGDWIAAKKQVDHYSGATHQKFELLEEAKQFMRKAGHHNPKIFNLNNNSFSRMPSTNTNTPKSSTTTSIKPTRPSNNKDSSHVSKTVTAHDDSEIVFTVDTLQSVSTPTADDASVDSPNTITNTSGCQNCATLIDLVQQLVSRIENIESKLSNSQHDPAVQDSLLALTRRVETIESRPKQTYKDVASTVTSAQRATGPLAHTNTQHPPNNHQPTEHKRSNITNRPSDPPANRHINFQPEKCLVLSNTSNTNPDQFRKLNHDIIRRTLSNNHGPLIVDMINRYKFNSANPRYIVQLSSEEDVTTVISDWKPDSFGGSTARRTISPNAIDHVGMARGVPLDIEDSTIKEVIDTVYAGSTFERLLKNGNPLHTVKVTFSDATQLTTAINKGLLINSCNMLFRVEPPYSTSRNIHN